MQQIEQRDKIAKGDENVIFRCRTDPLQCQITAVKKFEEARHEHHYRKIQRQIAENPILLYMKGSPKLPSCGFSAQAVQALAACGERFAYVDILQNPDIRAELPKYANWPTFPQLWVDGELVGGCDIVIEMYQRGELQQLIKETAAKYKSEEPDAE